MKKVVLLVFLGLAQVLSAQATIMIGEFSTVKAFDRIDVLLVKSTENKVEVSGSRKDDVEIVTKNDELKIRMKLTKLLAGEDISVTVYYTGTIERVEASEGARIASLDVFKATSFDLNAKEGAEIKLNLDVQKLKSKLHSGGLLNITGSADNHNAFITSGGILKANNLKTSQTSISINAGGEADIYASEYVDAKTRAGGNIKVYGNPKKVDRKELAGGTIKIMSL